jgi:hypothetical protein
MLSVNVVTPLAQQTASQRDPQTGVICRLLGNDRASHYNRRTSAPPNETTTLPCHAVHAASPLCSSDFCLRRPQTFYKWSPHFLISKTTFDVTFLLFCISASLLCGHSSRQRSSAQRVCTYGV